MAAAPVIDTPTLELLERTWATPIKRVIAKFDSVQSEGEEPQVIA